MPNTDKEQYSEAGSFIRSRREQLELTQADVVERLASMGITTSISAFHRLETGKGRQNFGDANFVKALAKVLKLSVEDILAVMGYLESYNIRIDTRTGRILEIVSKLSPKALEATEQMLEVLAAQQDNETGG